MIVPVTIEHVAVDEGDRIREARRPLGEQLRRKRQPRVADEALVVEQHRLRVLVAGHPPDRRLAVEAGLAEDGVVLPHLREGGVRVGEEVLAVEVVLGAPGHHAADATALISLGR